MEFVAFHDYFPELAEQETRSFIVLNDPRLPEGSYALIEQYCNIPGCDCRRVMFSVFSSHSRQIEAIIAYGWEEAEFYARWMGGYADEAEIEELQGPVLNRMSRQSKWAPAILEVVRETALSDALYVERLKRHYRLFKAHLKKGTGQRRGKKTKKARKQRGKRKK